MIKLWFSTITLTIPSDRIIQHDSPNQIETSVDYSVTGVPVAKGIQHETKYLWSGLSVLLTQSQLNTLNYLISLADNARRGNNAFAIGFSNTVFPFTEVAPRTRAIATGTTVTTNTDGSVTYFPQYAVAIKNVKASILGEWRQTSFDLIELQKVNL
jgi:hypothetical protein